MAKSPYLIEGRLADIIGAIPVLSAYETFASRGLDEWETQLGEPCNPGGWRQVFEEHPEFFRFRVKDGREWVGMRWRWALDRDYDPSQCRRLGADELSELSGEARERLTRPPLTPEQIESLMATAVKLHTSAIERFHHARWWVRTIIPALATVVGVILGALLTAGQ